MEKKDPELWTRTNVIALAILVEHIVIGLKIVIALVIPDVPHKVVQDEFRRIKIEEQVVKELLEIKYEGKHETFQDMQERMQREAQKIIEAQVLEEEENAPDGEDFMVTKKKTSGKEKQAALLQEMAMARQQAM